MATSEQATELTKEYLKKAGYENYKIIDVKDKSYKWLVQGEIFTKKFSLEISKAGAAVIKFETA